MSEATWTPADVAEVYDASAQVVDMFSGGHQHLGYWYGDEDDTSVPEASARLTRKTVDTLGLRKGENVLDAGCGAGAEATQVAEEYGVQVTGVTISPVGRDVAEARAEEKGLSDRVKFEVGDYHALDLPDDHFDAVIAIEALMHAMDLNKALLELRRVLRPGGRLAIAETTKVRPDAKAEIDFSDGPQMTTVWLEALKTAGFVTEEWIECGHRVFGQSGKRYPKHHEALKDEFIPQFGEEFYEGIKEAHAEWFGAGPEFLGYTIFSARKPA
jgi:cyclopropane fatty-acyl-phospholipid synthase-like methyltransferase